MPAFTIMRGRVDSFEAFLTTFTAHADKRRAAGMRATAVARDARDPNLILVQSRWDDLAAAKQFLSSDWMREAMKSAGVQSPEIQFLEVSHEAIY